VRSELRASTAGRPHRPRSGSLERTSGLVLIRCDLIARARSKAPLLVLGSFAIFDGDLEYSASLLIAVLLTAGSRSRPIVWSCPCGVSTRQFAREPSEAFLTGVA
jgi:hypothetical protein